MIQTLVLKNSVHRSHSQISMRILYLSLFHKFVEIRACSLRCKVKSSSGWSWYRCLVLKRAISLKNSFTTAWSWKNRAFVACRHRSERFGSIVYTSTQNWVRLQLSTLQLNLLFSNAIQFTVNLKVWRVNKALHPVKCFWCNYEKGYIYPSREM